MISEVAREIEGIDAARRFAASATRLEQISGSSRASQCSRVTINFRRGDFKAAVDPL
jgi:hypothetical protein